MSSLVIARPLGCRYGIPVIFRYDFDCGSLGAATSFDPMPSMDLTYLSMTRRSHDVGTLFVVMTMLSVEGLINSALNVDFIPLRRPLMDVTCSPALFMIELMWWPNMGTMACFLDGPLVVMDIFFLPLGCVPFKVAL